MSEFIKVELRDFYGRRIKFGELGKRAQRILGREAREDAYDVLVTGGNNIRNHIIRSMRDSPKTGKLYYKYKGKGGKRIMHRASSPGNPPRPDTGDLIRSIQMDENFDSVEVGSTITRPNYPAMLEKGTPRMKKRPWLEPAFKKYEPDIKRKLLLSLRRAAERLSR